MQFGTVAEAYSFYKNSGAGMLEARAQAIKADVAANPEADVAAYNIELEGIAQAKAEQETRAAAKPAPEIAMTAANGGKADDPAASVEYRSAFYKRMLGKQLETSEQNVYNQVNETRAAAFNTLSTTAAVIPTTTLNEIIVKAREQGGIFGLCRGFHMPANIRIPVATPGEAASWHNEGAAVDSEKVEPGKVEFGAYEIMRILSISAAVDTMSLSAFEAYLVDELSASVMATLAQSVVNGTGSKQGTGIIPGITWENDKNQVTVAKTGKLSFENLVNAIAMLKRGYSHNAQFAMNNSTLYNSVYTLTDDVKRPLFVADPTQPGKGRILGFNVTIDDYMADDEILFGDFRYMGYNMPAGIALDVSRESSFNKGLIDFRALAIADAKPIVDEAFVRITKATA